RAARRRADLPAVARYRRPTLSPGPRGVARIASPREPRQAGRIAAARADLQSGAGLSWWPEGPDRSAGGRLHWTAGRSGAESVAGYSSAAAGARLLDACEVAPGSR